MSRTRAGVHAISRPGRALKVLVVVALVAVGQAPGISEASSPPQSNVTVPTTAGQTVTDTWSGSIPALANASSNCGPLADTPVVDQHSVTLRVSAGLYDTLQANFTFNINWPADAGNDEILTVLDPSGNAVGSSDTGEPSETVRATNLTAGTYKAIACGFLSGPDPQPYGSLTVQTIALPPPPPPPPGPTRGITFDHANLNDPVRMVGEPDIEIDNHNGNYVSGPGGSTTQASWFWKSEDHGIQWHLIGCPVKSNCQNGGGDTEIAFGNNRDVFASDLQTLQCNSTFRSFDEGKTFTPGEGCFPETDRQWMGVYDPHSNANGRRIYLAANHAEVQSGCYLLVSTDNGMTYLPPDPLNNPSGDISSEGCIGRFAVDPNNGDIFVPMAGGTTMVSTNGGVTWTAGGSDGAQGNFFAPIQMDTAGNLWQAWTEGNAAYISYSTNRSTRGSARRARVRGRAA